MDIEVNTLAQIKAETGRDLDNQVDENTLVSGEKSNGTFGVFKLFAAIKNCIDNWITTIAGAKNFTGAVTINSKAVATTEAVNNALALYTRVCKFEEFGGVPNQVYTMDLSDLANNRAYLLLLTCPFANVSYYMGVIFNGSVIQNLQELKNDFFTVTYENKTLSMAMTYSSNNPFTVQIVGV